MPEQTLIRRRDGLLRLDLGEVWRFRELLGFFVWRDLKVRYKQTFLGVMWAFLQPFVKLVVFSVVFGTVAKIDSQGFPYPVFLFAGLLPWQFFADCLGRSANSVVGSGNLISKVYFPRLLLPLSAGGAALVDFAIALVILSGLMVFYGLAAQWSMLLLPLFVVLTLLNALGVGAILGALNVAFRDFRYLIGFLLQIWMYLTPVVYPVELFGERWAWVLWLNPMTGVVEGYRAAMLGQPLRWPAIGLSCLISVALFAVGIAFFNRAERRFADIL